MAGADHLHHQASNPILTPFSSVSSQALEDPYVKMDKWSPDAIHFIWRGRHGPGRRAPAASLLPVVDSWMQKPLVRKGAQRRYYDHGGGSHNSHAVFSGSHNRVESETLLDLRNHKEKCTHFLIGSRANALQPSTKEPVASQGNPSKMFNRAGLAEASLGCGHQASCLSEPRKDRCSHVSWSAEVKGSHCRPEMKLGSMASVCQDGSCSTVGRPHGHGDEALNTSRFLSTNSTIGDLTLNAARQPSGDAVKGELQPGKREGEPSKGTSTSKRTKVAGISAADSCGGKTSAQKTYSQYLRKRLEAIIGGVWCWRSSSVSDFSASHHDTPFSTAVAQEASSPVSFTRDQEIPPHRFAQHHLGLASLDWLDML